MNLYVTFSECAPMLPLESYEAGVPCIMGNNNHYFLNSKLQDLVVVSNEQDITEIKDKILSALENKEEILILYKEFRENNLNSNKKEIAEFIRM